MEDKFRWLAGGVLDGGSVEDMLETARTFEQVPDVRRFTQMVS